MDEWVYLTRKQLTPQEQTFTLGSPCDQIQDECTRLMRTWVKTVSCKDSTKSWESGCYCLWRLSPGPAPEGTTVVVALGLRLSFMPWPCFLWLASCHSLLESIFRSRCTVFPFLTVSKCRSSYSTFPPLIFPDDRKRTHSHIWKRLLSF